MENNKYFPEIRGNFGFGCMRLPMKGSEVDLKEFSVMIEDFLDAGFNYFDTAHGYLGGRSETAIRECLSSKYDRSRFLLTDKLTSPYFNSEEDIRPFFMSQLKACGVDHFDFYLMHSQNSDNYVKFRKCRAYETAFELKKEGYIRHMGLSFHDKPEVLDMILTENPEVEAVQIQFNYADYDDAAVESRRVYEVCVKHNKPVIVMEPVKGGSLVKLPEEADRVLRDKGEYSNAGYAIRFAASFENMFMVLSGMSDREQMRDNIKTMKDFRPFDDSEFEAVEKVKDILKGLKLIPCTSCKYCITDNSCPVNIRIPDMFDAMNTYERYRSWNTRFYYDTVLAAGENGKASDCISCGGCESVCPQHLNIRELLVKVADTFEK